MEYFLMEYGKDSNNKYNKNNNNTIVYLWSNSSSINKTDLLCPFVIELYRKSRVPFLRRNAYIYTCILIIQSDLAVVCLHNNILYCFACVWTRAESLSFYFSPNDSLFYSIPKRMIYINFITDSILHSLYPIINIWHNSIVASSSKMW